MVYICYMKSKFNFIFLLGSCFLMLILVSCNKTKSCKCEVTRETTKTGKGWTVESVKTIYEPHDNCDDGDRTEVLVMPTAIFVVGVGNVYSTNGVREITDCGK